MEDNKSVLTNILWMIFDKVFVLILNLLVTVRIANHYGSSDYGTYQYAVSIVAIIEILVTFVDGRVLKKMYVEKDEGTVVYSATVSRLLFSGISAIIGIVLILCYNPGGNFRLLFIVLLLNAILTNLRFGMANRFEYHLLSKKVVLASDVALLVGSFLQLGAVQINLSIVSISVIAVISSLINFLIVFVQYRCAFAETDKQNHSKFNSEYLKTMVRESAPLAIAASCATIYNRCDSVMLGAMLTTVEVGIYSIANNLIKVVQIVLLPIRESFYPSLVRLYYKDKDAYAKRYVELTSLLTWICIIGVSFSFLVLPFLFRFLNEEYASAFPVYKIYVVGTLFMYNAGLRAGHYTLINRGKILAYSQIVAVFINLVLNYVGITIMGMYGAALATAITQCISLLISNLFFKKDGREVFIWQVKAINPVYAVRAVKTFVVKEKQVP